MFFSFRVFPLLLFAAVSVLALADKAPRFLQQECSTNSTTTETTHFSGLLIIDIEGQPGFWTETETMLLEAAILVAYGDSYDGEEGGGDADAGTTTTTTNNNNNGFYEVFNVTVDPPTFFGGSVGSSLPGNFSLPVFLEGWTNLTAFVDADGALFAKDENTTGDDMQHGVGSTRVLQDCASPLPNKAHFVDLISRRMAHNTDFVDRILDVHETAEVDCPGGKDNVTEFTSGIAIQAIGNVDLVDTECLSAIAESVASLYNMLNILNEDTCDPHFREIDDAEAFLDGNSIQSLLDDGVERGRKLMQSDSFTPTFLASSRPFALPTSTPSPSTAPSIPPSTFPSRPPSSPPSSESSSTLRPTTNTSTTTTGPPTNLPTTYGADLNAFTLLIRLGGQCRGCTREQHLFDEGTAAMQRKTSASSSNSMRNKSSPSVGHHRFLLEEQNQLGGDDYTVQSRTELVQHPTTTTSLDSCYCSAEATKEGAPTESEFLDAFQMEISRYDGNDDDNNNDNKLDCLSSVTTVEEIRIFDCDQGAATTELVTQLDVEFLGHLDTLTEEEVMTLEATVLNVFQGLEERVCDPYQRSISSVQTVTRGFVESPDYSIPSESVSQSTTTQPSRSPEARRSLQTGITSTTRHPSHQPLLGQTSKTTFPPSLDPTTIQQPTSYHTSEPTLFSLTFELTGDCRGCHVDNGLFHRVIRRRKLRLYDLPKRPSLPWRHAGSRRLEGQEGKCGCGLEAPDGGVTEYEFASNFAEQVDNLDLRNVRSVNGVESTLVAPMTLLPTTSPSPSTPIPTAPSSQGPSMTSSENQASTAGHGSLTPSPTPTLIPTSRPPTRTPSLVPSPHPTPAAMISASTPPTSLSSASIPLPDRTSAPPHEVVPLSSPSLAPTSRPTPAPTPTPTTSPSSAPTHVPTSAPAWAPTQVPTSVPSLVPTQVPTAAPSSASTQVPTSAPSSAPTLNPTPVPSSAPTQLPTAAPSSATTPTPTSLPTIVPATTTPTSVPSLTPTVAPSPLPTSFPTSMPSALPTRFPTKFPTVMPSSLPTQFPTKFPTAVPTQAPTASPVVEIPGDGPCFANNRGDSSVTNGAVEAKFDTNYAIIDFSNTGLQDLSQYTLENFGGFNFISLDNGYYVTVQRTWASLENPGFMILRSPHNEGDPELITFADPVCTAFNSLPPK